MALGVFVGVWLVYRPWTVSQSYNVTDPLLMVPTSLSIVFDHDLELGEYVNDIVLPFHGLLEIDGHAYNNYPIGGSLLVLPLVWLAGPPGEGTTWIAHAQVLAAAIAKIVAAFSVALLFLLLAEISGDLRVALGLSLVFAFATPHFPIHAGGIWTHNLAMPLTIVAMLLLAVRDGRHAWAAAIPLGFAFVTRPTTVSVIALSTLYVAWHRRRSLPAFLAIGLVIAGMFVAWSRYMYGTLLPPYYLGYHVPWAPRMVVRGPMGDPLLGNLVSPNRGLFVFAPILAFALWGMVRAFRYDARHAPLLRFVALLVVVHWVMISSIMRNWWAGWSFGPRNFMDVLPLFVVLCVPAVQAFAELSGARRAVVGGAATVALAWSLFTAVHGATSQAPHLWNAQPIPLQQRPERIWDWRDMQVLRGTWLG
jgi:hypothetical protein